MIPSLFGCITEHDCYWNFYADVWLNHVHPHVPVVCFVLRTVYCDLCIVYCLLSNVYCQLMSIVYCSVYCFVLFYKYCRSIHTNNSCVCVCVLYIYIK